MFDDYKIHDHILKQSQSILTRKVFKSKLTLRSISGCAVLNNVVFKYGLLFNVVYFIKFLPTQLANTEQLLLGETQC